MRHDQAPLYDHSKWYPPIREDKEAAWMRYDLSPAAKEGALRDKLIALGWTPPVNEVPKTERELVVDLMQQALTEFRKVSDIFNEAFDRLEKEVRK